MRKYATMEQVCWRCDASRGPDVSWSLYNLSGQWVQGCDDVEPPWDSARPAPALTALPGFACWPHISLDLLHIFYIGIGRDCAGSCLKLMIQSKLFFPGTTITQRMSRASLELQAWADAHRVHLSCSHFSKARLQWGSDYPMLRVKGADCMAVLRWLASKVESTTVDDEFFQLVATCLWSVNAMMDILHRGGIFLSREEAQSAHALGKLYLQSYLELAGQAVSQGKKLWKLRPKFHLFWHVVHDLNSTGGLVRNVSNDETWLDEDYVGKLSRLVQMTHSRTSQLRAVQRYLVGLPELFRSMCSS